MTPFVTVKDAAQRTGKSPSSIRRIIYPIIHDDAHADRAHIQPGVEEAMQLRMKGENFAWRLSKELLRREVPAEAEPEKGTSHSSTKSSGHAEGELLAMVRGELEIKNQQIADQSKIISEQMEVIKGLGERLREGNVLIGSLQQHFSLPEGRGNHPISVKTKTASSTQSGKGSTVAPKSAKPKKRFLPWFFR